ncbi:MAG TPA: phasin family protein [Casimicrobiaceae bacterium]
MLKKAKAKHGSNPVEQAKNLSQAILDSSHKIWLAGLGAFAKAQQEGGKVFDALVQQGESVEAKTRAAAAGAAEAARDAAKAKAKEMQAAAGETWDKLEQVFEKRVARALGRLGVYSAADVKRLTERVDALSEAVNALLKAKGTRPVTPAGGKPKVAAKKGSRRKVRPGTPA